MIEILDQLDKNLFLFLNSFHSPIWDQIMWFITGKKSWIPFYLLIVAYLFKVYKWNALYILACIGLIILLADRFASGFCKGYFERFRPSHAPDLKGLVHLFQYPDGNFYKGGEFGFISSHAANTFGLATYLILLLKNKLKHIWLIFIWALVVSYSRIYVGVHYPGDIIAGALSGVFWAFLVFKSYEKLCNNYPKLIFEKGMQ